MPANSANPNNSNNSANTNNSVNKGNKMSNANSNNSNNSANTMMNSVSIFCQALIETSLTEKEEIKIKNQRLVDLIKGVKSVQNQIDKKEFKASIVEGLEFSDEISEFMKASTPDAILKTRIISSTSFAAFANSPACKGKSKHNVVLAYLLSKQHNESADKTDLKFTINGKWKRINTNTKFLVGCVVNGFELEEDILVKEWLQNRFETKSIKDFADAMGKSNGWQCSGDEIEQDMLKVFSNEVFGTSFCTKFKSNAEAFGLKLVHVNPFAFVDAAEVLELCKFMRFSINDNVVSIGNYSFKIDENGIFDDRGRRLMSVLAMDDYTGIITWVPSHTVFIAFLAGRMTKGSSNKLAQHLLLNFIWESEAESGAEPTGDRLKFNFYNSDRFHYKFDFDTNRNGELLIDSIKLYNFNKEIEVAKSFFDVPAFMDWNLMPMHKGHCPYYLALLSTIRVSQMPELLRNAFIAKNQKFIIESLPEYTPEEALRLFSECGVFTMSTKVAKLSKRTGLLFAKQASPLNPVSTAFITSDHDVTRFGLTQGLELNTIYAPRALGNPGAAVYVSKTAHPGFKVFHNQEQKYPGCARIDFSFSEKSTTKKFGGKTKTTISALEGEIYFAQGAEIATISYDNGKPPVSIFMPEDGIFMGCELTFNKFKEASFSILYYSIETKVKIRGVVKALMTKVVNDPIRTSLNTSHNLDAIEAIILADSDKSSDMLQRIMGFVAQTLSKTEEGRKTIRGLNAMNGINQDEYLVFDATQAGLGHYDTVIAAFEAEYLKSIWLSWKGSDEFRALLSLYMERCNDAKSEWNIADGTTFETIKGLFPNEEIISVISNGSFDTASTDVLVFIKDGDFVQFHQRTFAYVGVALHVRPELCSVAQSTGVTNTIASVAKEIETMGCPQSAREMMGYVGSEQNKNLGKYIAALNSISIDNTEISVIKNSELINKHLIFIFDHESKVTAEFKQFLLPLTEKESFVTFAELQEFCKFTNFKFKNHDFAQALVDFDMIELLAHDHDTAESPDELRGMLVHLFNGLRNGANFAQCEDMMNSIQNNLRLISNSNKLAKKAMHGFKGVSAKAEAFLGARTHEVFIKKSFHSRSVYRQIVKVFGKDFDGMKTALGRSPIPFPAILQLVLIDENHWAFDAMSEFTMGISGLANAVSGGDFDGDNYSLYKLCEGCELPLLTMEAALDFYTRRTGLAWNHVDQGSYFADHWTAKPYKAIKSLVSSKNFMLEVNVKNPEAGLLNIIVASTNLQSIFVGVFHKFAYIGGTMSHLAQALDSTSKETQQLKNKNLSLCLMEVYEAGLGGLNWDLYNAMRWLYGAMSNPKTPNNFVQECVKCYETQTFAWFVEKIGKGGCNANFAKEYHFVATQIRNTTMSYNKNKPVVVQNTEMEQIAAVSCIHFMSTKGHLGGGFNNPQLKDLETLFGIELSTEIVKDNEGKDVEIFVPLTYTPAKEARSGIELSIVLMDLSTFMQPVLAMKMKKPTIVLS